MVGIEVDERHVDLIRSGDLDELPEDRLGAHHLIWGLCGAVFINCGRALLLESRPRTEHGRVLANYQLALLVSSPLGAVLGGVSAEWIGAKGSMSLLGLCALAVALALVIRPHGLGVPARGAGRRLRRAGGR